MALKKPAVSKRASLPRACDYTREFHNDWQRLSHSGRYDLNRLKEAILAISNDGETIQRVSDETYCQQHWGYLCPDGANHGRNGWLGFYANGQPQL